MFTVQKETASMQTRDGVRLDADVYRPAAEGKFPVLLMRQPYGRAIASTVVYAHPTWYAAHGYIVVIQDVRGRGTSEGEFVLFAHEMEDGYDSVVWAAALPNSTGAVGMYGFSYQGMTQLYAAATHPPALKVICPAMLGYDLYTDWAYEGGAFCWQANLGWAIQISAETARLKGDTEAYRSLSDAARALPLHGIVPTQPEVLRSSDPTSFYHHWLEHSEPGEFWQQLSPKTYLTEVDLPMLHIGGWYDTFMRGTLHLYEEMSRRSQHRQQLLVGPWGHLPWGRTVGSVDFGPDATSPCDRLQLRWFDQFLKGADTGLLAEPPVQLFEMGRNRWCNLDTWPAFEPQCFYLSSTGLASIDLQDGSLTSEQPDSPIADVLVHDPWRPVPALGGHASAPSGCFDRRAIDDRTDVLTYTTAPLTHDLHLVGTAIVELDCSAETPSFDLCAVLSIVYADGRVHNLSQGYRQVKPGEATRSLQILLQPICASIAAGNQLRLSLSGACFPAYPVNAGTGSSAAQTRAIDHQIIPITVYSGGDRTSKILLPVQETAP